MASFCLAMEVGKGWFATYSVLFYPIYVALNMAIWAFVGTYFDDTVSLLLFSDDYTRESTSFIDPIAGQSIKFDPIQLGLDWYGTKVPQTDHIVDDVWPAYAPYQGAAVLHH